MLLGGTRFIPFLLAFTLLALAVVCLPNDGHAQPVPVTEIENAAGVSVLTVLEDGGFAVYGEEGIGTIPIEGEGTRMMWYPAEGAFRAGEVDGTQWDDANVGKFSVAMGQDTEASNTRSVALGYNTTASGLSSTAIGVGTTASGFASMTMGSSTTASGGRSVAMGYNTTAASSFSLTIGKYNSANSSKGFSLFVVGNGSSSTPSDALVLDRGGDLEISGTLTETSDRRLKEQIQPLGSGVLGALGDIEPVRFRFKNEETHPSGTQLGLIAQEVQAQFPALVSEGASGHLSVSYSKFTAVLLKGLQEQQAEIARLEAKVNRMDQLEARLATLEQKDTSRLAALGGPWLAAALLAIGLLGLGLFVQRQQRT
jgi:hypothetical protein